MGAALPQCSTQADDDQPLQPHVQSTDCNMAHSSENAQSNQPIVVPSADDNLSCPSQTHTVQVKGSPTDYGLGCLSDPMSWITDAEGACERVCRMASLRSACELLLQVPPSKEARELA